MKREKFLWPITHAHHFGLMAAKTIQRKLEEGPTKLQLQELRKKAERFFKSDLAVHIGVEERILDQFAFHRGPRDSLLKRARAEHKALGKLLKKGDIGSLRKFSEKLIDHVYFEEDELFKEIEEEFTQEEKEWVETDIQFNIYHWPRIPAFVGDRKG